MSIRLVLVMVGFSLTLFACNASGAAGGDSPSVATVYIYSGRADPTWTLNTTARSDVSKVISGLKSNPQLSAPDEGKLGFRWIEVSHLDTAHGQAVRAKVAPRVVVLELSADGRTLVLEDRESRTLQALLKHAEGNVEAEVLDAIRQEIR